MKTKILILTLLLILAVQSVAFAGSVFCNDLYWLSESSGVLSISTNDYEMSWWMRQDGDPTSTSTVAGKGLANCGAGTYYTTVTSTGLLNTCVREAVGVNGQFNFDITAFLDDDWHHYYVFIDRSDVTTCEIWVDGVERVLAGTSGTMPTSDMTHGNFFTAGAGSAGGNQQEGYLADLKIKIGGTMASQAQIEYQAANPYDYSSSAWNTADGEREAWRLDEGSGTNAAAEIDSPTNDLTATNSLIWNASAPAVAASGAQVIIITN